MIQGLTDQAPAFKEVGRIRKGGPKRKKTNKYGKEIEIFGEDLDHFRVTFREDPDSQIAKERFQNVYGTLEPHTIRFFLPFPQVERVWSAWFEIYHQGGMIGRADRHRWYFFRHKDTHEVWVRDGEVMVENEFIKTDEKGNKYMPFDPSMPVYGSERGKAYFAEPIGRLRCLVPAVGNFWQLTLATTAIYDIMKISQQLSGLATIAEMAGRTFVGIPLILSRRLEPVSCPMPDGGRIMQTKWLVNIDADPTWAEQHMKYLTEMSYPALPEVTDLPAEAFEETEDLPEDETDGAGGDHLVTETAGGQSTTTQPANGSTDDLRQKFWDTVYKKLNWTREQGMEVLSHYDGDFTMALVRVMENLPPE
jgi:Recombination directionality factor-like